MNIKKSLLTAAFALSCMLMSAQTSDTQITKYTFSPYWYGQLQFGAQETLGEGSFGKLLSPNAQIAVGRQFNPLFGLRLSVGSWQSKGTINTMLYQQNDPSSAVDFKDTWKYKYIAPALDLTFNLTNAFGGYNPERKWDINAFAGIGVNVAWGNDHAQEVDAAMKVIAPGTPGLQNLWDGVHARLLGRMGLAFDYRVSNRVQLGLELNANVLNDNYNSKKAENADWYFNGLVGLKYTFGTVPTWSKQVIDLERVVVEEKIVERVVEVPVEVAVEEVVMPETMRRDVFFAINSSKITLFEQQKVRDVAEFMKANPDTKVLISGYADKATGTVKINVSLAKRRAEAVATMLKKQYGIAADRISTESMGTDEYQPYPAPDPIQLNRVAICVVK